MPTAYKDYTVKQGYPFNLSLLVRNKTTKVAKDISDYTFRMTVKTYISDNDANALIQDDTTNGTTSGTITITLTKDQTITLPCGEYFYDIMWIDGNGVPEHLMEGKLIVEPPTTISAVLPTSAVVITPFTCISKMTHGSSIT